ncbi:unnamed protein product [Rotaria socialis]|uniref:Uncharacterized protein n=1 Tax=Rotaria socialis TaxID=392032 RepID=A0A818RFJ9_9BILA|nr:unnamed protein product [Rotaria socialis]
MTKRPLDTENKENELEQFSPSIATSSLAFNSIDQNVPKPAKKARILEEKVVQQDESSSSEEDDDEDDDEGKEKGPWPIGAVIQHHDGTVHSKYKQYIVYENTEPEMISKTARFWSRKYLKVLQHVDPDSYDMYIHNDFACYGELEVLENCIIDIAKGIFLKHKKQMNFSNYIFAFRRLEALTTVLNCSQQFVGIDDGERFCEFIRLIGACYITILRGLLPKTMFNDEEFNDDDLKKLNKISQQLPNFKQVIKQALILSHDILSIGDIRSAYVNILHTIYCKWSMVIDKIRVDLKEKPHKKDETLWEALKHAAEIKKTAYRESYNFMKEFDLYSKNNPGLGGHSHDLRKWPKAKKNLYSFDTIEDENDDSFWFRL